MGIIIRSNASKKRYAVLQRLYTGPKYARNSILTNATETVLTYVQNLSDITKIGISSGNEDFHQHEGSGGKPVDASSHPHAVALTPVFRSLFGRQTEDIVAVLFAIIPFDKYLSKLLPDGAREVDVVLRNTCGQAYEYRIRGQTVSLTIQQSRETFPCHLKLHCFLYAGRIRRTRL